MDKKELENEIMKTQEQLKNLQAALKEAEEREKEVPNTLDINVLDKYCYVSYSGNVHWTNYTPVSSSDTECVRNRRAFKNREYAEMFAEKTQFIADLLHFKYLYDRDYKPNWDSEDEQKFYVYYNAKTKEFEYTFRTKCMNHESVYFSTKLIAERCTEWLNKKYN